MGIFRRKRSDDTPADGAAATAGAGDETDATDATDAIDVAEPGARADRVAAGGAADGADASAAAAGARAARSGPLDRSEAEGPDGYVDLGALWLPAVSGLMLTMEVDESTGDVTAVRVHLGDSVLQLQAFAAPRTTGIWGEIREELVAGIEGQGGSVEVGSGPLGVEVLARVPGRGADGRAAAQSMRFVGVDGPRWFVRGVVSGEGAGDPELAAPLLDLMRACVVVRGDEPMGPRELLPLTLPTEDQGAPGQDGPDDGSRPSTDHLDPFVRGPEITETR